MEIKEIKSKKLFKEFNVSVLGKLVESQIDEKIKEIAITKTLPGFRPGKAPLNLVKKKYEKDILGEVINKTVQDCSKKLLEEKKIKPLRFPKIEITKFDKEKTLEFNIKIDLPPEIKISGFEDFKLTNYQVNVTDSEIKKGFDEFVKNLIDYKEPTSNRIVRKDDQVTISFQAIDKDVPEALKKQENVKIIIGSKYQLLPNIDKILIENKTKKEDSIKTIIDLSQQNKDMKNQKKMFEIKVLEIKEPIKVDLNEDYLKKLNLKSKDDLKKQIETNLTNQYKQFCDEIYKKQLLDLLDSKHSFDIPEGILEDEFNLIWEKVKVAKKNNSLDKDDTELTEKDLMKRYKNIASRRIKIALLMSEIGKQKEIVVSNEELSEGLQLYARNYPGQEKQVYEYFKNNPSEIEVVRGPIFEKKIIDYISKNSKNVDKKIDTKELYNIQKKIFN